MFEAIVNGRSRKSILDGLLEVESDEGDQFDLRKRLIQSVLLSFKGSKAADVGSKRSMFGRKWPMLSHPRIFI